MVATTTTLSFSSAFKSATSRFARPCWLGRYPDPRISGSDILRTGTFRINAKYLDTSHTDRIQVAVSKSAKICELDIGADARLATVSLLSAPHLYLNAYL